MKKAYLLIVVLFYPFICSGQNLGPIYLKKNIAIELNQDIVKYLTEHLKEIKSVGGKTVIYIPIRQEFKKERKSWIIGRHLYQYEWKNKDIEFDKIKTTVLEFDFDKDKITTKNQNDDDNSFLKDKDAKEKIKSKDKPSTGVTPGGRTL